VSYTNFFLGSLSVAGALTGLLFVALSVAQSRDEGSGTMERQAVAATAFTALVDSLWVSLVALLPSQQPGHDVRIVSIVMGLFGVTSTAGLIVRLWRARSSQNFRHRWPVLLPIIIGMYAFQAGTAAAATTGQAAERSGATFVMVFFAVGIARSWELLGVRGGGLLDLLVGRGDRQAHAARAEPDHAVHREASPVAQQAGPERAGPPAVGQGAS
jgi:hypothetical protein